MTVTGEYRKYAIKCVEDAHDAKTETTRARLLDLAENWRKAANLLKALNGTESVRLEPQKRRLPSDGPKLSFGPFPRQDRSEEA
jgi:hypothetical protein